MLLYLVPYCRTRLSAIYQPNRITAVALLCSFDYIRLGVDPTYANHSQERSSRLDVASRLAAPFTSVEALVCVSDEYDKCFQGGDHDALMEDA